MLSSPQGHVSPSIGKGTFSLTLFDAPQDLDELCSGEAYMWIKETPGLVCARILSVLLATGLVRTCMARLTRFPSFYVPQNDLTPMLFLGYFSSFLTRTFDFGLLRKS